MAEQLRVSAADARAEAAAQSAEARALKEQVPGGRRPGLREVVDLPGTRSRLYRHQSSSVMKTIVNF